MHVSTHYYDMDKNTTYANHDMYYEKIGMSPDRIKNMHFLYAILVRAINRIHDQLIYNDYTTGLCERDDSLTIIHMTDLLTHTIGECALSFNESTFFNRPHDSHLLEEIQERFYNISRVFDCIGCDKCRFNGKVQIKGLGAAMKILFSNSRDLDKPTNKLTKTEIIALINTMNKLSESIDYYENFLSMEDSKKFYV